MNRGLIFPRLGGGEGGGSRIIITSSEKKLLLFANFLEDAGCPKRGKLGESFKGQ